MNYQPSQARVDSSKGAHEPFTADDAGRIQTLLRKKLGPEHVSTRQGMGNSRLSYVEGWRIISIANEIFGFDGWSSSIQSFGIDYMDMADGGRYSIGATCVMRITLRDGTFREDVGFGMIENVKSKGQALEKVRKEAVTDALKRAMRQFGNVLGNCVYDKEFVRSVSQVQKQPRGRVNGETLFRQSDLDTDGKAMQQLTISGANGNGSSVVPTNQFQSAKAMNPNIISGTKEQPVEDAMEFDMDDMDDAGVLGMLEDLETQRPVIPDSPILRYSGVENQQTPARVSGNVMTGAPASARNLSFRPPPQPSHTPDRPRSFADVSSFVPSSAGSNVGAAVHRLSLGSPGIHPSPPKRQHS